MKPVLSLAAITLATSLAVPALHAQAVARPRSAQVMTADAETPYLGIGGQDITADRAKALRLKEEIGAEVTMVYPDTAAAKAGLKDGDVVLEYNGQKIEGWEQLKRMVSETPIRREVKIGIWRNGAPMTLTATMGSHSANTFTFTNPGGAGGAVMTFPEMKIPAAPMPPSSPMPPVMEMPMFHTFIQNMNLGVTGEMLSQEPQLAEYFGVKDGMLVRSVIRNSAAEKAGMKAGDVIVKIDDTTISGQRDITAALRNARGKKSSTVVVNRKGKEVTLNVNLESGYVTRGSLWGADQFDWDNLQFFPNDGVIQGAEKSFPKIIWQ